MNNLSHLTFKTSALQNTPNQSIRSSILTIPSIIRPRMPQNKLTTVPNLLNLTKIKTETKNSSYRCLSLSSLNGRSVENKTVSLCDFIQSNDVDLLALSETWLDTSIDKSVTSEFLPDGYDIHQVSRKNQGGGGIAVVFKKIWMSNLLKMIAILPTSNYWSVNLLLKINTFDYA